MKPLPRAFGILFLCCPVLLPAVVYMACYCVPQEYTSTVVVGVLSRREHMPVWNAGVVNPELDPHFIDDQVKILQSKTILQRAADELGLAQKWADHGQPMAKEQVYERLSRMLFVRHTRGDGGMARVEVTGRDPREAADIANTIAQVYVKLRREEQAALIMQEGAGLKQEVDRLRAKVEQLAAKLMKIRLRDAILDPSPDSSENEGEKKAESDLLAEGTKLNEATQRVQELKAKLEQIDKMSFEEKMSHLPEILAETNNPPVQRLQDYNADVAEEAKLKAAGAVEGNNARLKGLHQQIVSLRKILDEFFDAWRMNLTSRLRIAETYAEGEQKNYDALKIKEQSTHAINPDYAAAKAEYIEQKKLLDAAVQRYETKQMQLQLTTDGPEIREAATPAKSPSVPNAPLYLTVAEGIGILLAAAGWVMLFVARHIDAPVIRKTTP